MKRKQAAIILLIICNLSYGQDTVFARSMIDQLASERFSGRGYVENGVNKSAGFIDSVFDQIGLKTVENCRLQRLSYPINTFPGKVTLKIDGKRLKPVLDYVVGGGSPSSTGKIRLEHIDTALIEPYYLDTSQSFFQRSVPVMPYKELLNPLLYKAYVPAVVYKKPGKIHWRLSDATVLQPFPYFIIRDSIIENAGLIEWEINNMFYPSYETCNVIGMVPGTAQPDSFYVITAHYDHLGKMGKGNVFPGANDNASGTAMLMDLARHLIKEKNQPEYSVVFIAFTGEECGLFGSRYFIKNPLIDLKKIKFLINLDMVGTGSAGLSLVNGKNQPKADSLIKLINNKLNLFNDIRSGEGSCNSDHCPFVEAGVPGIFMFTRGGEYRFYHEPGDSGNGLPLDKWNELHELLCRFISAYHNF